MNSQFSNPEKSKIWGKWPALSEGWLRGYNRSKYQWITWTTWNDNKQQQFFHRCHYHTKTAVHSYLVQLIKHAVDCAAVARYTIDSLILKAFLLHNPRTGLHNQRHHLNTTYHSDFNVRAITAAGIELGTKIMTSFFQQFSTASAKVF